MNRGLEDPESTPVRALAVGSSPWLRTAIAALDGEDGVTVRGPIDPETEPESNALDETDCVLTDERATLERIGDARPVVVAVDGADGGTIQRFLALGASDVIGESAVGRPALLAHRLRRTAESAAVRTEAARRETRLRTLLEQLTERQREVVRTAYRGGFFEWPRGSTGEEPADSLGISSPAFQKRVRAAERKLFTGLFDGRPIRG